MIAVASRAEIAIADDERAERYRRATGGALDLCYQCGTCTASCPVVADGGRPVRIILRRAALGLDASHDAWRCTACRQCEARCPRGVNVVEAIMGVRSVAFEDGAAPPEAHRLLWSTLEEGNPWGGARSRRGRWADGLPLKDATKGVRVLLYAGCAAAYDPRLTRVARALARLLLDAGLDVGVLGNREACCGDSVRSTGERAYLERLVAQNVKTFAETGAETIVALSPHCYDAFRNLYPRFGLTAEVVHATEMLARLADADRLPRPARRDARVAYHDPCYLGRANGVYEAPRRLLETVPGLELVELRDARENALCCGGGGGGMWRRDGGERTGERRYRDAAAAGVDVLATSCPYCVQNFEDAGRRARGPRVADVVDLLAPGGDAA